MSAGMTLPEALISVAVLGVLASLSLPSAQETLARQRLEAASRTLGMELEQARSQAEKNGSACGLSLSPQGWAVPASSSLQACLSSSSGLDTGIGISNDIQLIHTFPAVLRVSSNGLVLDGGTAVLRTGGTTMQRCLVMAPPLGVVRVGRYMGAAGAEPTSAACIPDPSL
jgi:prepilin-type N-terminal cleavage/methylation domain-containing protein